MLLQMSGEVPTLYVGHAGVYVSSILFIWGRDMKVCPSHLVVVSQPRLSPLVVASQPQAHIPFYCTTIFSFGVSCLGLTGHARRCTVPSFCLEVTSTTQPSRWFCPLHVVCPKGWLTCGRPLVADNTAISENNNGHPRLGRAFLRWHPRLGQAFSWQLPPPTRPLPMVLPHSLLHNCHCNNRHSSPYPICWACWCTHQQCPLDLGQGHKGSPEPSHGSILGLPKLSCGSVQACLSPLMVASRLTRALLQQHPGLPEPSCSGVPGLPKPNQWPYIAGKALPQRII
jgi:hypothetical protein